MDCCPRLNKKGKARLAFMPLCLLTVCRVTSCRTLLQNDGLSSTVSQNKPSFLKLTLPGTLVRVLRKAAHMLTFWKKTFSPSSHFCGQPPTWQGMLEFFRHCKLTSQTGSLFLVQQFPSSPPYFSESAPPPFKTGFLCVVMAALGLPL